MGLDSVELILEWEKYFNINIADREAEKIRTVQDAVDHIATLMNIKNGNQVLKNELLYKMNLFFRQRDKLEIELKFSDHISEQLTVDNLTKWEDLSKALSLKIPLPFEIQSSSTFFKRMFGDYLNIDVDFKGITYDNFTDSILGHNFRTVIDRTQINEKYEIYVAVMGITEDRIGVSIYDIERGKSFVDDLGVD